MPTKQYQLNLFEKAATSINSELLSKVFKLYPFLPDAVIRRTTRGLLDLGHTPYVQTYLENTMIALKKSIRGFNPIVQKKLNQNFFINECVKGAAMRGKLKKRLGIEIPETVVISPTMKCNLRCSGCYSAQYAKDSDLEFDVVDRLITEANSMGLYFFVITGGEPFVYPQLFDIIEKHGDCWFQIYTSGILLDTVTTQRLAALGNVNLCISVEGYEEETDRRRGKGHFKKVLAAFQNMREAGLPFGFSATATRENNELIMDDRFVEFYQRQGACFGWYFQYMPIGRAPDLDLVPTPEQRIYRFYRMIELRRKFSLFLIDFWNDGWYSGGCIAGGRGYLHVNHRGDIEPCVFCQIAVENIHTSGLFDTLTKSPLFNAIRKRQPYNKNLLLPCLMIDNPDVLRDILKEVDYHETCGGGATRLVSSLYEHISEYSKEYSEYANDASKKLFNNGHVPTELETQRIAQQSLCELEGRKQERIAFQKIIQKVKNKIEPAEKTELAVNDR